MGMKKLAKAARKRAAAEQLVMKWVPVTDASGRTHMEAVWISLGAQTHATSAA